MASTVRWGRSSEAHVTSHCQRFRIAPLYCGTTRPQGYMLWDYEHAPPRRYMVQTIREAKEEALDIISRESAPAGPGTARKQPRSNGKKAQR